MDLAQIRRLDAIAMRAVPAEEVHELDGWLLRRTVALTTRRVNSVLARDDGPGALPIRLARVESFYREAQIEPRFQLSPACGPADLRAVLIERGYVADEPTVVQIAALTEVPRDATMLGVELTGQPTDAWWSTWAAALVGRRTAHQRSWPGPVAELMKRIATPCAFAVAATGGERSAVGMGVVDGPWLGIFNMATVAAHRRRGAAGAALAALLSWGLEQGAGRAYLQVRSDNVAALRLYARAGFRDAYRYEYLTAPAARL